MIKFVDENGVIYEGQSPYVHWAQGIQSTGLWYNCKMFVISDQMGPLICEGLDEGSAFKFVNKDMLPDNPSEIADLGNITSYDPITIIENNVVNIEDVDYYIFQVLLVCKSDSPGQFTDTFQIRCIDGDPIDVVVGADFYEPNEILGINLSNKGADIPVYIEKAIYDSNYKEVNIDNILINRKFKELISNYIDVLDCKGSYKSLINSLEWFDWGDNIKIYEVWKGTDERYFEKGLELILSQIFRSLLYTQSKTTYISLVSPLQRFTDKLDAEKNPIIENIIQKWTNDEIAVKVSILGAFFERFFMPIHMDLKRASAEALVCTIPVRIKSGDSIELTEYMHDTGVVSIDMPDTVVLGNLDGSDEMHPKGVAVDRSTLFGKSANISIIDINANYYVEPVGVKPLDNITSSSNSDNYSGHDQEVADTYSQLVGNVGVVIPVEVTIDLPVGDGINMEMINVYKDFDFSHPYDQVISRKYYAAEDIGDGGKVRMKFYLLSTKEETISFSLMFTSLSGHAWTASAGYEVIDVSGCKLSVCKVTNNDYTNVPGNFMDFMKGNPWASQYNTIKATIDEDKYEGQTLIQYLPYGEENINQYNEIIAIENQLIFDSSENIYDERWKNNVDSYITNNFWMFDIGDIIMDRYNNQTHERTLLIKKKGGGNFDGVSYLSDTLKKQVRRHEMIFIPQLHSFNDLDKMPLVIGEDGRYKPDNYKINETDLLCVIPQFKQSIKSEVTDIRWEFINKTTHESVKYDIPLSKPMIANKEYKYLHPGYWSVIMRFKLGGVEHEIIRNSAFIMI